MGIKDYVKKKYGEHKEERKIINKAKEETREKDKKEREMRMVEEEARKFNEKIERIKTAPERRRQAVKRRRENLKNTIKSAAMGINQGVNKLAAGQSNPKKKKSGKTFGGTANKMMNDFGSGMNFGGGNMGGSMGLGGGMKFGGDIMNPMGKPRRKSKSKRKGLRRDPNNWW